MSHNDFFNPLREIYNPPNIPPNNKKHTLTVPYNIPTVMVLNPSPPPIICPSRTVTSGESRRNGSVSLTNNPSGKRYSSINNIASRTPFLVKKVLKTSAIGCWLLSLGCSSSTLGSAHRWNILSANITNAATPMVICQERAMLPVDVSTQPAIATNPPCPKTVAIR